MERLTPMHLLNPPLLQNPSSLKLFRSHSTSPHVLEVTDASPETSPSCPSFDSSSLRISSNFHFHNDLNQLKSLNSVKVTHAQIIKRFKECNSGVSTKNLITSYLRFGDFRSAVIVFFVGFAGNYPLWRFLKEFGSSGGNPPEILEVFSELHCKGVILDGKVLSSVLRICANLMESWLGMEIHALLIKRGFEEDASLISSLMNFYGRCWDIESATQVFCEMPCQEDQLWNEAIIVNLLGERLGRAFHQFREMQFSYAKAYSYTIVKLLQACGKEGALSQGKQIHGYVLRSALESNVSICNSLISMYSKNNKPDLARKFFHSMENHNVSSWNSIISGYATLGYLDDAWNLFKEMKSVDMKPDIVTWNCLLAGHFLHASCHEVLRILRRMQDEGFRPNSTSVNSILQAVSELKLLNLGKEIHGYVIRNKLDYDVYVETSLVDMYVKNDVLTRARKIFDNMKCRNIFAWNSLISGYSFKGLFENSLELLKSMENEGIKPDLVTWNSLVSGYSMWSHTKEAVAVIHKIRSLGMTPNVVSWTALISGCSQKENYRDSLEFFIQMQQDGIQPNSATISSLLRACAGLSLLQKGEEAHCHSIRKGFADDVFVVTALIDMYSRSGSLKKARHVYEKIQNKTLASWNCMIMGLAIYGLGKEAITLFDEMCVAGFKPDAITFTSLLSSCKNSGLVDEGWKYFDSMRTEYNIIPTIEHYSCMVDLLGRSGYLDEAWDFVQTMPMEPDATVWGALLRSCQIQKNVHLAQIAAQKLFKLEPYNSANYVLMMNSYAISNRWEDVDRIKDLMGVVGVKNRHVWSWTQVDQTVHVFSAEGKPHPDEGQIFFELYRLVSEMKKLGYVADTGCVYQNIDENEKGKMLLSHTEKLAMTYGLMKTKNWEPIRVIKNTRICSDCHTAAKYMTLVKDREIFLKDGVRFHHFREGRCSCNECW